MDQNEQELVDALTDAVNVTALAIRDFTNALTLWLQSLPIDTIEEFDLEIID